MSLEISIGDADPRGVSVTRIEGEFAHLWIDGRHHRGQLRNLGNAWELTLDDRSETIHLATHGDQVFIHAFGRAWRTEVTDPAVRSSMEQETADLAVSPMPGTVLIVAAQPGQAVMTGEVLVVIESMKMESDIVAWRDGIVDRVHVAVGDTFDRGASLVSLLPRDEEAPAS